MTTIRPANFSMHLPVKLRARIKAKVESGEYSSVAAFLIESANKNLKPES